MQEEITTHNDLSEFGYIRMVLTRKSGKPYRFKDYRLTVDGVDYLGKTDSRGLVEQIIPENSQKGKLFLLKDKSVKKIGWQFDIVSNDAIQGVRDFKLLNH